MPAESGPEVVLLCGVAGVGKTTYAQAMEARGYARLSVDEELWDRFGRYGVDYDPSEYEALTSAARQAVDERLVTLVAQGHDVVVDSSLWQRSRRDECKRLVERAGGRWRLVYLKADEALLRERLSRRAARFDANAPFPVTDDMLERFLGGFEVPSGEGEEVILWQTGFSERQGPRRWRTVAVVTVVVALVVVGGIVAFSVLAQRWGGNVPSGVACEDLPPLAEVQDVLGAKAALVRQIQAVGPMVEVIATAPCEGRYGDHGEVHITFGSFDERDRVLDILEREPFGVPVGLVNV